MHLTTYNIGPPGGWSIMDPKTGIASKGITFQQLVSRVATARANNNVVTVGNLAHEVEELLCARLKPKDQVAYCETGIHPPTPVNWHSVERFMLSVKDFIGGGCQLVDQPEAERRAGICASCPYNVGMVGCALCQTTLNGIRDGILKVKTSQDDKLQACGICGCDNKTQVHAPLDALRATADLEYPTWCWKRGEVQTPHATPETTRTSGN